MSYTIATTTSGVNLITSDIEDQAAAFKTALSLDAVNNTSDLNKPVSTAQQAALDLKSSKALVSEFLYSPASLDHALADDKAFLRNTTSTNAFTITARKGPSLNYTRATAATTVDADGLVKYSPENLLQRSDAFNTTPWVVLSGQAFGTGSVANDTTTLAPDGTYTADRFNEASSGITNTILRQAYTFEPSIAYTFSVYARYVTRAYLVLYCSDGPGHQQIFNLSSGSKGSYSSNILSSTMTAVGNSWYRCSITFLSSPNPNTNVVDIRYASVDDNSDTNPYTCNGSCNLLWGAQLERSLNARQYLSTTTSSVYGPRFWHDPSDLTSRGLLLETESTNICWPSNIFSGWTYLGTVCNESNTTEILDPAGTNTADIVLETIGPSLHQFQTFIANTNILTATKYTFSCFVKPKGRTYCALSAFLGSTNGASGRCVYSLSGAGSIITGYTPSGSYPTIKAFANGWYRVSMTTSATTSGGIGGHVNITIGADSTCGSYSGDSTKGLYVYGAQVESGGRASTYIPTGTGTVNRAMATCNLFGNDFASIYNQSQGTIKVKIAPLDLAVSPSTTGLVGIEATDRSKAAFYITTYGDIATNGVVANNVSVILSKGPGGWPGVTNVASYWTPWITTNPISVSFAYKNTDCNAAFNGVAQSATTNTTLPFDPMTQLVLGANATQSGSGIFSRLTIYKSRISNEYLKIATS